MVKIKEVEKNSVADKLSLLKGDSIYSINGNRIRDEIDVMFYECSKKLNMEVKKNGKKSIISTVKLPEEKLGVKIEPFEFRTCKNACIFCFYDQMPEGLRETLYQKDDDYRLSFLYGNYITLKNLNDEDYQRIEEQRLSPLYVSVHSTNPEIRRKLLGGTCGECDIKKSLQKLVNAKIEMHTQIVICPGINDDEEMQKTVFDLSQFFPYVRSISVIPVGLTRFRKGLFPLREPSRKECLDMLNSILLWHEEFREKFGVGFVYPSDEILIKGEFAIPMREFYDGFPQLENGVGSSRLFLDGIEEIKTESIKNVKGNIVFVTSMLPLPWINLLRKRIVLETSLNCDIICVQNRFFGKQVTVSGLLVGEDVKRGIENYKRKADIFIIPDNCLNEDRLFLDHLSLEDISMDNITSVSPFEVSSLPQIIEGELGKC
jgi:putative radical SAM enzyme (TIGR03279 family)